VDQPEVDERHQPLLAQRLGERVLVAHRQDAAAAAVLDRREDDVRELRRRRPWIASSSSSEPARCGRSDPSGLEP
jgi:hypothetical protein